MERQSNNRHFKEPKDFDVFDVEDPQAPDLCGLEGSVQHTIDGGNLDEGNVQDVGVILDEIDVINGEEAKASGIEDAETNEQGDENTLEGGSIYWQSLERQQKAKWRGYITGTTLLIWILWTGTGIMVYVNTGNSILLLPSGAAMGIAFYRVLFKLIKYYYGF